MIIIKSKENIETWKGELNPSLFEFIHDELETLLYEDHEGCIVLVPEENDLSLTPSGKLLVRHKGKSHLWYPEYVEKYCLET